MSEAIIAKKAELVDVVAEKMKAAASIVVVDARGLTVEQDTVLRRGCMQLLQQQLLRVQNYVLNFRRLLPLLQGG